MKKLLQFFIKLVSKKLITNVLILLLMLISFIHSTCFFVKMFQYSFQTFGILTFILIYFVLIYWKESDNLIIEQEYFKYFMLLKAIILTFLFLPFLKDLIENLTKITCFEIMDYFKRSIEFLQILGVEIATKLLFLLLRFWKR